MIGSLFITRIIDTVKPFYKYTKLLNFEVENGVDLRKYSRCYFIKVQFIKFRFFILSQWL